MADYNDDDKQKLFIELRRNVDVAESIHECTKDIYISNEQYNYLIQKENNIKTILNSMK